MNPGGVDACSYAARGVRGALNSEACWGPGSAEAAVVAAGSAEVEPPHGEPAALGGFPQSFIPHPVEGTILGVSGDSSGPLMTLG